jgi:hypothetical protein
VRRGAQKQEPHVAAATAVSSYRHGGTCAEEPEGSWRTFVLLKVLDLTPGSVPPAEAQPVHFLTLANPEHDRSQRRLIQLARLCSDNKSRSLGQERVNQA